MLLSWLPPDVRVVRAPSAGVALGVVRRDAGQVFGGVMLDHDLQQRACCDTDRSLTGKDVVEAICRHFSTDIPVLVHSSNTTEGPSMVRRLRGAGFDVTRISMMALTPTALREWVEEAREIWEELEV